MNSKLRSALQKLISIILVFVAYWNICAFEKNVADLPSRNNDELVVLENRYANIRALLIELGYSDGPIIFITNHELQSKPPTPEDVKHWAQGQYAMVPWTLLRNGHAVSGSIMPQVNPQFVIADFWEGPPATVPAFLSKLYDSGDGLILYRTKL